MKQDEFVVPIPVIDEDEHGRRRIQPEADLKLLTEDDFFDELVSVAEVEDLNIPIFEVFMKYFGQAKPDFNPICLTSLIDPEYDAVIALEDKAEHYHILPYGGGWHDQTAMLVEAFDCIRSAKIQYDRVYTEKVQAKVRK